MHKRKYSSPRINSHVAGLTLLETLLVLAIMAAIVVFSLNQYTSYRRQADVATVQSNVDLLFSGMVAYFRANCRNPSSPLYSAYNKQYVVVKLSDLIASKYVNVANNIMPFSNLVDNSGEDQGYFLQFNQVQIKSALPQRTVELSSDNSEVSIGSIIVWQIEVGARLRDTTNANATQFLLNADCLADAKGGFLESCVMASSTAKQYAVWNRLPSYASTAEAPSPFWVSMPVVRQFSQMYDTYPILDLTDGTQTPTQYYRCGGG